MEPTGHFKYFRVYYTKDVRKKKRVFSEGILACENNKTKLFSSDGDVIVTLKQKNDPEIDEEYELNYNYAVVIDSQVSREEFTSGRVFLPQSVAVTVKPKAKVSEPSKSVLKQEIEECENGLQVESFIFKQLRQHQKEGIQFMYDCLLGFKGSQVCGCILADFMGLGKTLQTLTLIYSLLKMNKIKKAVVVAPLTLLGVWEKECKKWLESKLKPLVCFGDGDEVKKTCTQFANNQYRMMIISYESFYRFVDILNKRCDLIVFDEGHRLKNKNSKVFRKILSFSCRKRVILTGTPLQNNLNELYSCISIVNPTLFGSEQLFKNIFKKPIIAGMAKNSRESEKKIAYERTLELANKIKTFSLRRKAQTLEQYLPIKHEYFVLFQLTSLQKMWYETILKKKQSSNSTEVLSLLNQMRKLFTHPQILKKDRINNDEFKYYLQDSRDENSFKIDFIVEVCLQKKAENESFDRKDGKQQKIVIMSYFTETLDFIAEKLRENDVSFCKLDGRSEGKERLKIVSSFEREKSVLLLSGKAGGTGLTLVCAQTMIMVEPDWNPSNDAQVIGRIWRQGQSEEVSIYRLLIVSSFEERIVERQQLKNSLSEKLIDQQKSTATFDFFDMKQLFMQNTGKSLLFKEEENRVFDSQLQSLVKGWKGVVHLQLKNSHQSSDTGKLSTSNEFELLNFCEEHSSEDEEEQVFDDEDFGNSEFNQYEQKNRKNLVRNQKSKDETQKEQGLKLDLENVQMREAEQLRKDLNLTSDSEDDTCFLENKEAGKPNLLKLKTRQKTTHKSTLETNGSTESLQDNSVKVQKSLVHPVLKKMKRVGKK